MDPRIRLSESLEALLVAELTDNDGWVMLIQLADTLGHKDLSDRFRVALQEENTHLNSVRQWISALMQHDAKRELDQKH